jgi:hypothetical protein
VNSDPSVKIDVVNKMDYNGSIPDVEGNCFFKFVTTPHASQVVNLQQYSLFIDSGQAQYNLSAYLMCRSVKPDDQAYVTVRFLTQDKLYAGSSPAQISKTHFVYNSNTFCLF